MRKLISPRRRRIPAGFTILELLIAMTILAFISLGIYQTTTSTFALRENLTRDGEFYNSVRVVLDIVGRDVSQMYSPQAEALPGDLGKALPAPVQGQPVPTRVLDERTLPSWGPAINEEGVRASRIRGEESSISFIVNNHIRLFRDTPESDFAKVEYRLEQDPFDKTAVGKTFIRIEDTNIFTDRDTEETKTKYTMLAGVKTLTFEYLDGDKDRFEKRWDSQEGLDTKDRFPTAIKVKIEVYTPTSPGVTPENTFAVEQIYRPELPL